MRNWESQTLPGILEDGVTLSVRLPSEALTRITEALTQLREVDIPDWLESGATRDELYAAFLTLETWEIIINMIRGQLIKKAIVE